MQNTSYFEINVTVIQEMHKYRDYLELCNHVLWLNSYGLALLYLIRYLLTTEKADKILHRPTVNIVTFNEFIIGTCKLCDSEL